MRNHSPAESLASRVQVCVASVFTHGVHSSFGIRARAVCVWLGAGAGGGGSNITLNSNSSAEGAQGVCERARRSLPYDLTSHRTVRSSEPSQRRWWGLLYAGWGVVGRGVHPCEIFRGFRGSLCFSFSRQHTLIHTGQQVSTVRREGSAGKCGIVMLHFDVRSSKRHQTRPKLRTGLDSTNPYNPVPDK